MAARSVSFDDPGGDDLFVFSGRDLLIAHYDVADLDWEETAERSALDQRRGLVIAQVAVVEDLIGEFIEYLADPKDPVKFRLGLDGQPLNSLITRLEQCLGTAGLRDDVAASLLTGLRAVAARRNELAHGTLHPAWVPGTAERPSGDREVEWLITSRRDRTTRRITMRGLREDLDDAIGVFIDLLSYAESFVEEAPLPVHFTGGFYLGAPTP